MPEFFRDDITKPLIIDATPVEIKPSKDFNLSSSTPGEYTGGYCFRYLNSEKNSRLLAEFKPNKIWEIKWLTELDSNLFPWFLLLAGNHIIVQNESGWQLFNNNGKLITSSAKTEGNLSIDINNQLFYQNEFSGFLSANDLAAGEPKFLVYPYFGKGYDRSVIWFNEHKFLSVGYELPAMTHKSSPKSPEITLFELLDVSNKSMIDPDKILNSAQQIQKLILKARNVKTASSNGIIVAASEDFISVIDPNLNIKKIFHGKFIPEEISLDEQLNIYLIVRVNNEEDDIGNFYLWVINQNGELVRDIMLPFKNDNPEFYPPIVGFDKAAFILAGNRLISVESDGIIKWDNYLTDDSPGASVSTNGYLLTSEGDLLSAIDSKGERSFIFQFESEKLFTPPLLNPQNEIYVATKNFLYCIKLKGN